MDLEYHIRGDPSDDWYTQAELESAGYTIADIDRSRPSGSQGADSQTSSSSDGKPAYWDVSPYRDTSWPPTKLDTNALSPTYGQQIPDDAKIERYRSWEESYLRQQQQDRAVRQNTQTDNELAAQKFAYQQQQDAQTASQRSKSIEQMILDAFVSGDREKAIALRDFRDAPTKQESLRFAMQYADSEEEFWTLYNLSQGFISPTPFGLGNLQLPGPNVQEGVRLGLLPPEYGQSGAVSSFNLRGAEGAMTPAALQQAQLKQDYLKAGGALPGQPPMALPTAQKPGGKYGMATDQILQTILQDPRATAEDRQGAQAELDARTAFTLPTGTPANRTDNPWMFESDETLKTILNVPETSDADKAAAQAELDRRDITSRQQLSAGAEGSFASFMRGGPDVSGKLTGQEAANLAAGNPYEGEILTAGPTGQWDTWVPDPNFGGINPQNGQTILKSALTLPTQSPVTGAATSLADYFNRRRQARMPQRPFITPLSVPAR